ncbi:MAG: cytochrome C oxidase assembly protein [Pseudomonadota bacterium]
MSDQDIKERQARNNFWVGLTLLSFVALVFAITVVKMRAGHNMEGFDHVLRPQLEIVE